jgi:hypothetical protein
MWTSLGVAPDNATHQKWSSRPDVFLRGVCRNERALDVINLAWAFRNHELPDEVKAAPVSRKFELLKRGFFVNHSQQNIRKPWGSVSVLTTSTHLYSFELDREILPEELFLLQGHPPVAESDHALGSDRGKELRTLSGEGVSVPMLATCMYSIILQGLPYLWKRD